MYVVYGSRTLLFMPLLLLFCPSLLVRFSPLSTVLLPAVVTFCLPCVFCVFGAFCFPRHLGEGKYRLVCANILLCQDKLFACSSSDYFVFHVFVCHAFCPAGCRNRGAVASFGTAGLHASASISSEGFSWLVLQRLEFASRTYFMLFAFYVVFWRKDFSEFGILLLRPQRLSLNCLNWR